MNALFALIFCESTVYVTIATDQLILNIFKGIRRLFYKLETISERELETNPRTAQHSEVYLNWLLYFIPRMKCKM